MHQEFWMALEGGTKKIVGKSDRGIGYLRIRGER
jgi:hypothetical protein